MTLGGVAFAELHGVVIVERNRGLRLVLDGCPRPTIVLPEDIAITTLADSPELAEGVWRKRTAWSQVFRPWKLCDESAMLEPDG
jgi:hypothetical protein